MGSPPAVSPNGEAGRAEPNAVLPDGESVPADRAEPNAVLPDGESAPAGRGEPNGESAAGRAEPNGESAFAGRATPNGGASAPPEVRAEPWTGWRGGANGESFTSPAGAGGRAEPKVVPPGAALAGLASPGASNGEPEAGRP